MILVTLSVLIIFYIVPRILCYAFGHPSLFHLDKKAQLLLLERLGSHSELFK